MAYSPPVDLSDLKPEEKIAADNPTGAPAAAAPPATPAHAARTAFLVIINHDGGVVVSPDVNMDLTLDRFPTLDEIQGAVSIVAADVTAQKTAVLVQQQMATVGRQMQDAQEQARIRQQLAAEGRRFGR